jgi:hypothetical protein
MARLVALPWPGIVFVCSFSNGCLLLMTSLLDLRAFCAIVTMLHSALSSPVSNDISICVEEVRFFSTGLSQLWSVVGVVLCTRVQSGLALVCGVDGFEFSFALRICYPFMVVRS